METLVNQTKDFNAFFSYDILNFLKKSYEKDMKTLSDEYGGYCTIWNNKYYNDLSNHTN